MKIIDHYFSFDDARGWIRGIDNQVAWKELNVMFTKKGEVRGNHFHQTTTELIYIIQGNVNVEWFPVNNPIPECLTLTSLTGVIISPGENHTFTALEDTIWINALDEAFNASMPDINTIHSK